MTTYPEAGYDISEVIRAGSIIAGDLPWTPETAPDIRKAFTIANNWRDAHAYPTRSVRYSLMWFMRHHGFEGITAARLKRMQAIRRKLRRLPYQLCDLQDLGGCRVILPSIADVRRLGSLVRDRSRHVIREETDYIRRPKKDGYRSHHLMLNFQGHGKSVVHDHRRIELQIRTRLQHSWATAVEAVGLFRGEDLKGKQGSEDWLRLFKLMSAEFAMAEGCKEPSNVPCHDDRVKELRELDGKLDAAAMLQNMSHTIRWTDIAISSEKARYYLIRFDNTNKRVVVEPHFTPRWAMESYDNAEALDNQSGLETANVVLVEADKIEGLKAAYPNYFGDVQLFKAQLNRLLKGKDVEEYTVAPQERVTARRPHENPDLTWFKRRIRWS
jgi:hypothetical protein